MVWSTAYDAEGEKDFYHCAPPRQLVASNANSFLDHMCELDVNSSPAFVRLTGIMCTVGPSSVDTEVLEKMMETGMNIARLNFSYRDQELHLKAIRNIRTAAENYGKRLGMYFPVAIALDMKGPEIRLGLIEGGLNAEVELKTGEQIKLTTDQAYMEKGSASVVYVGYDNIQKVVQVGHKIYIDDGSISVVCTNIQGSVLTCVVEIGGTLGSWKSINIPGVDLDLSMLSDNDKEDINFGLENEIDIIIVSHTKNASTLSQIRSILGAKGSKVMVVAKIESQQGLQNLDEIIKVSDGIMIGRSNLGIALPVEKVFLAQKCIISRCNKVGKPVICANQMMSSMIKKARPTRAECTDVANAVLDGADCVLLNVETAKSQYPVESVLQTAKICKEAEAAFWNKQYFIDVVSGVTPPLEPAHAVAIAAVEASSKCLAAAIVVVTTSGRSAFLLAKYRPSCPIISVTRNVQIAKQAHLYRGVFPVLYSSSRMEDWSKDVEVRISYGISFGKWRGFIRNGDPVIAINGSRKGSGSTDTLRILYVTKPPVEGEPCGCD